MSRNIAALDSVHRFLSRSSIITRAAILVRNQCRAVIKYRLATSQAIEESGESWLIERLAPHCRTFVDVGANRGTWTAAMLRDAPHIDRGVAYEPGSHAAAILRDRVGDRREMLVIQRALSDHVSASERFFEVPNAGHTSSFFRPSEPDAVATEVEVSTLDREAEALGLAQIDVLKIDAEGHDLAVLRGAQRLLSANRVRFIQWEYGDAWIPAGATLAAALATMDRHGYRSVLLKRDGVYRFDYDRFGEVFAFSNFVSVHEQDIHILGPVRELV